MKPEILYYKNLLILRGILENDAEELVKMHDSQITKNFSFFQTPLTVEKEKKYLKKNIKSPSDCLWIIYRRRSLGRYDSLVGTIGLHEIDKIMKTARLGIIVWRNSDLHHGYGIKTILSILNYGFSKIGLEKIYITILQKNKKNKRLYKKIGFMQEGILRKEYLLGKKRLNMVRMGILKNEWIKKERSK